MLKYLLLYGRIQSLKDEDKKLAFRILPLFGSFVHYLFGGFQFNVSKVFLLGSFWGCYGFWSVAFWTISVGILPYPLTFLITESEYSEIYGRKKANRL